MKITPVQVAVRIRPIIEELLDKQSESLPDVVRKICDDKLVVDTILGLKSFDYKWVFGPESTQREVYGRIFDSLEIGSLFSGRNATIFTYGQCGTGKSHSIGHLHPNFDDGLLSFCISDIFEMRRKLINDGAEVGVWLTSIEINNNSCFDLLANKNKVNVREGKRNFFVEDLKKVHITDKDVAHKLLVDTASSQFTQSTATSSSTSNSHIIYTISIRVTKSSSESTSTYIAKLNLVDLAGSERMVDGGAKGRIRSSQGLTVLHRVMAALSDKKKNMHIPYRESVLTKLLKESLGGDNITVMLACVSPAARCVEETLSTLSYANMVSKITNNVEAHVLREPVSLGKVALKKVHKENKCLMSTGNKCSMLPVHKQDDKLSKLPAPGKQNKLVLKHSRDRQGHKFSKIDHLKNKFPNKGDPINDSVEVLADVLTTNVPSDELTNVSTSFNSDGFGEVYDHDTDETDNECDFSGAIDSLPDLHANLLELDGPLPVDENEIIAEEDIIDMAILCSNLDNVLKLQQEDVIATENRCKDLELKLLDQRARATKFAEESRALLDLVKSLAAENASLERSFSETSPMLDQEHTQQFAKFNDNQINVTLDNEIDCVDAKSDVYLKDPLSSPADVDECVAELSSAANKEVQDEEMAFYAEYGITVAEAVTEFSLFFTDLEMLCGNLTTAVGQQQVEVVAVDHRCKELLTKIENQRVFAARCVDDSRALLGQVKSLGQELMRSMSDDWLEDSDQTSSVEEGERGETVVLEAAEEDVFVGTNSMESNGPDLKAVTLQAMKESKLFATLSTKAVDHSSAYRRMCHIPRVMVSRPYSNLALRMHQVMRDNGRLDGRKLHNIQKFVDAGIFNG